MFSNTARTTILILLCYALSNLYGAGLIWDFETAVNAKSTDDCVIISEQSSGNFISEGFAGRAAFFEGKGFIETKTGFFAANELTITALVKLHKHTEGIGNYIISACESSQPNELLYGLRTNDGRAQFVFKYSRDEQSGYIGVNCNQTLPLNEWVFITAVKDKRQISLYVNGTLSAARDTTDLLQQADNFYIGQETNGSRLERNFNGLIDNVSVFGEAKSSLDIAQNYADLMPQQLEVKKIGDRYFFVFEAAAKDDRFPDSPVRLKADINFMEAIADNGKKLNPNSIRVHKWNSDKGEPENENIKYRFDSDLHTSTVAIGWLREESSKAKYAISILPYSAKSEQDNQNLIPMIGIGEAVSVGSSKLFADLGQGLAGYPSVVDWNGNGRLDLLVSFVIPRRILLYENIGTDKKDNPILKAPVMVWEGKSLLNFDIIQEPGGQIYTFAVNKSNPSLVWESDEGEYIEISQNKDINDNGERKLQHLRNLKVYGLPSKCSVFDLVMQDIDGDGVKDLVMGVQEGVWWWPDGIDPWNRGVGNPKVGYGKGYDSTNRWVGNPPMGSVYIAYNEGTNAEPQFANARLLTAGGEPIKMPTTQISPCFVDLNGNGKLDLLLATGVDRILAYYNTAENPNEIELSFPVNALRDTAVSKWSYFDSRFEVVDWDGDGKLDVLMSSNPGLVVKCKIENGKLVEEQILKCKGGNVWAETLVVPTIIDFNNNGKWDIITGDSSGFLSFFENSGTNSQPLFASREKLRAGGCEFRPVAGYSGSIQGPSEARWGYLAPEVYDWDSDGKFDVILSDITGYVYWLRNIAQEQGKYEFTAPIPLEIDTWRLKVRWRTRPCILPAEPLPHLITTDQDGYLALYRRDLTQGESNLKPAERLVFEDGSEIRIDGPGGYSGRGKYYTIDWDKDGVWDLIAGQPARSGISRDLKFDMPREPRATVSILINKGTNENPVFAKPETLKLANGENIYFGTHSCAPAPYDVNNNGWDDLFIGEESGTVRYYHRSVFEDASQLLNIPMSLSGL